MIIRVDKCSTFGIKKASTSSVQYLPKLILNHDFIPTAEIGKSFKYLGRYFNFSMDNHNRLSEVLDVVTTFMAQIDCIPCHPKNKLMIYHRFVLSKISWHFTIPSLGKTWVVENIHNLVASYIRERLKLPISATLSTLILPTSLSKELTAFCLPQNFCNAKQSYGMLLNHLLTLTLIHCGQKLAMVVTFNMTSTRTPIRKTTKVV